MQLMVYFLVVLKNCPSDSQLRRACCMFCAYMGFGVLATQVLRRCDEARAARAHAEVLNWAVCSNDTSY